MSLKKEALSGSRTVDELFDSYPEAFARNGAVSCTL